MSVQTGSAIVIGRVSELTEGQRSVLLSAGVSREGAPVTGRPADVQAMILAGYVGQKRGLTRAGVNARGKALAAMLDELF